MRWVGGEPAKEGTYPSGRPPPRPHAASPQAWRSMPGPIPGRACALVGSPGGRRAGRRLPPPPPPPADSVWPPARGCVFVSALPPRSPQLNPFQTRGALTGHHDEAESEADSAASRWPFPLSHAHPHPCNTPAHTHCPWSLLDEQSLSKRGGVSTDNRGVTTAGFSKHLHLPLIT